MTRTIASSAIIAMLLLAAAGGHALSKDFNTWQKNFGTIAGKAGKSTAGASPNVGTAPATASKRRRGTDPKETITIHRSHGEASKHKGEIEIQSFGGGAKPARGWPSKIEIPEKGG